MKYDMFIINNSDCILVSEDNGLFTLEVAIPYFYEELQFTSKKDLLLHLESNNLGRDLKWDGNISHFF